MDIPDWLSFFPFLDWLAKLYLLLIEQKFVALMFISSAIFKRVLTKSGMDVLSGIYDRTPGIGMIVAYGSGGNPLDSDLVILNEAL